jgi:hypothetical protein
MQVVLLLNGYDFFPGVDISLAGIFQIQRGFSRGFLTAGCGR